MIPKSDADWFEFCLDKYPDLPSVALIRSIELKNCPREFLKNPVLDLCCGDGFFTQCLGLRGAYGCDIDAEAVQRAGRLRETYAGVCVCDARDLRKFQDREFRTVFSNCALEHVDGIDPALASIARVLKTDGHLIMSVPDVNLTNWFFLKTFFTRIGLSNYGQRLCDAYNKKQEHINIHSLAGWRKKLKDNGLLIEKSFYLFRKKEYQLITFFESFAVDLFPCNFLRRVYSLFRKGLPLHLRKSLLRKLLKKIYRDAGKLDSGGEIVIIARKRNRISIENGNSRSRRL